MICTKYSPGERVRVTENFDELRYMDDPGVDDDMFDYKGVVLTISGINESYRCQYYTVSENTWLWDERWLEPEFIAPIFDLEENELMNVFGE